MLMTRFTRGPTASSTAPDSTKGNSLTTNKGPAHEKQGIVG